MLDSGLRCAVLRLCALVLVEFKICTFCFTTYSFLMTLVSWFAKSLHTQQGHDQSLYSAPFTTAVQNLWNFCLSFIFPVCFQGLHFFISTVFNQRNMKNCTLGDTTVYIYFIWYSTAVIVLWQVLEVHIKLWPIVGFNGFYGLWHSCKARNSKA